ncbi:hypothetical protein BSNK01_20390 [Bacillaceae bacterium]
MIRRKSLLIASCLVLSGSLVSGCSTQETWKRETLAQDGNKTAKLSGQTISAEKDVVRLRERMQEADKLSVLTEDGGEIALDKEQFLKAFAESFPSLQKGGEPTARFEYTLVLWEEGKEPLVMQIGKEGIAVEGQYFHGTTVSDVSQFVRKAIADQLLKALPIDRIVLTAKDLNRSRQLSKTDVSRIRQVLAQAQYIEEENPRIKDPLFPNYFLEFADGGKELVQVNVISPTLLSLRFGEKQFYYQLQDSIFSLLKETIPIIDYSPGHLKYLFKADQLVISDKRPGFAHETYEIAEKGDGALQAKAITHYLARLLSAGREEGANGAKGEVKMILTFYVDDVPRRVQVFEDHFTYLGKDYYKARIAEAIAERIERAANGDKNLLVEN